MLKRLMKLALTTSVVAGLASTAMGQVPAGMKIYGDMFNTFGQYSSNKVTGQNATGGDMTEESRFVSTMTGELRSKITSGPMEADIGYYVARRDVGYTAFDGTTGQWNDYTDGGQISANIKFRAMDNKLSIKFGSITPAETIGFTANGGMDSSPLHAYGLWHGLTQYTSDPGMEVRYQATENINAGLALYTRNPDNDSGTGTAFMVGIKNLSGISARIISISANDDDWQGTEDKASTGTYAHQAWSGTGLGVKYAISPMMNIALDIDSKVVSIGAPYAGFAAFSADFLKEFGYTYSSTAVKFEYYISPGQGLKFTYATDTTVGDTEVPAAAKAFYGLTEATKFQDASSTYMVFNWQQPFSANALMYFIYLSKDAKEKAIGIDSTGAMFDYKGKGDVASSYIGVGMYMYW